MANKIHSGGVFALWSQRFTDLLDSVFESTKAHIITFPNLPTPCMWRVSENKKTMKKAGGVLKFVF